MPQYKLGTGRMLLIINRAPVPEIFDLHTAGISLLNWWNVMRIGKFYDLPLPSRFPPTKHKSFNGIRNNWGGNSVWFTPLVTDLSPRRTPWVKVSQPHSNYPSSKTLWWRLCGWSTCVHWYTSLTVTPSICQWNIAVNKLCSSGPSPGLELQLVLHPPRTSSPFFFFAMLNDYVPARTYLIPGELPAGAKEFSLYISGWCLQKSSDGIWQVVCQHRASQSFTQWLSPQHGRSAPLSICCSVSVRKKRNHTYLRKL